MSSQISEPPFLDIPSKSKALPRPLPGAVSRPHLLRCLLGSDSRLTLTVAPAGFGKSVLHGECARLAPPDTQVIWLDLLGHTPLPRELLGSIAEALGGRAAVVEDLCRLLGRIRHPVWLMIDDYPRQASPLLDACLEDLLERAPQHVRWWISGRRRPAWSLPRLMLQGDVLEFDAGALAFDSPSLQGLLSARRIALGAEQREQLLEACAGWPALICLLLREATADTLPQLLASGTPLLLNYLQREVQPEQMRDNGLLYALLERHPHWFEPVASAPVARQVSPLPGLSALLSKRELAILQLIASGLSNQEIADQLCLSVNTVKSHAWNINGKLGTERRTQAVAQAKLHGLLG